MSAIERSQQTSDDDALDLNHMIGPDVHRPGPARARLLKEQIPVWAIIGDIRAITDTTDQSVTTQEVIARVAADFDVPPSAVHAALRYYQKHRDAIDALLEANAAATA